jgi:hypothetical protein
MKLANIIEQPAAPEPPQVNIQAMAMKAEEIVSGIYQNPQAADELKEVFTAISTGRQLTREQNQVLLQYIAILSTN